MEDLTSVGRDTDISPAVKTYSSDAMPIAQDDWVARAADKEANSSDHHVGAIQAERGGQRG